MKRLLFATLLAALGCDASRANSPEREPAPEPVAAPCEGCALELPPNTRGPVPLLVVLHGDGEQASKWFERWRGPAIARGYGVLALQCPSDLGCEASCWYRWNGNSSWVTKQVAAVAEHVAIDRAHSILVGWSGGATYIGMHADDWHRDFAAIVIHGGGVPPRHGKCPARAVPTYFFVGDRNLHHDTTKKFRDYFEECGSEVKWDVVAGADHQTEDKSLDAHKAGEILDWAAANARPWIAGSN